MLPFHVLAPDAHLRILHYSDMPTLLQIRATCRFNLAAVQQELQSSFKSLLHERVPVVDSFMAALVANRSYVGGSVAVAFLARDLDITPGNLDVFTPRFRGVTLLHHLVHVQKGVDRTEYPQTEEEEEAQRRVWGCDGIWQIYHVSTPRGQVNIYVSVDEEALVPIAGSWATHLLSYVNPDHFGTAYPVLFFAHRALLGSLVAYEAVQVKKSVRRGFDLRLFPTQWGDLRVADCGASRSLCPTQARYFDDSEALCTRFQPLQTAYVDPTVVWRMDGRPCGQDCYLDYEQMLHHRTRWYKYRARWVSR
ncbi:hypothetical protein OH76DRAFT_1416678 [Lentinus brumalis]|uniref:Uncharacterized protein n=1 Tax=Lentinus brumalis TaxID=2498619 RepID=A0A371DJ65_9APHY|nr:hypothetical protein OH76DRAFT_1416678 [Polyporus brumalis]